MTKEKFNELEDELEDEILDIIFFKKIKKQIKDLKATATELEDVLDMDNMQMLCNIKHIKKELNKFYKQLDNEIN